MTISSAYRYQECGEKTYRKLGGGRVLRLYWLDARCAALKVSIQPTKTASKEQKEQAQGILSLFALMGESTEDRFAKPPKALAQAVETGNPSAKRKSSSASS